MSHFIVLVIGPDVAEQLQPYHEYECTGIDDKYVVDVDVTAKVEEEFNTSQSVVRLKDGRVLSRWSDEFYTKESDDPVRKRLGSKEFVLPAGAEQLEMSAEEARSHGIGHLTLEDAAQSYCDAKRKADGRFYKHTNPNAKWDWWVVGGRWTGKLKLKPHCVGIVGTPGLMTENAPVGYADQARKGNVDFEQMRNDAGVKARALWKRVREITGGLTWDSWDDTKLRYKDDIDRARREYLAQPAIELLRASQLCKGSGELSWEIPDDLALDEEIYIQRRRDAAVCAFAFVQDGIWTERGKMGWWAAVSDEISEAQWNRQFNDMLDALPDDTLLTVVDCHI